MSLHTMSNVFVNALTKEPAKSHLLDYDFNRGPNNTRVNYSEDRLKCKLPFSHDTRSMEWRLRLSGCIKEPECDTIEKALNTHWTYWTQCGMYEYQILLPYAGPKLCPPSYAFVNKDDFINDLHRKLPKKWSCFENRVLKTAINIDKYGKLFFLLIIYFQFRTLYVS